MERDFLFHICEPRATGVVDLVYRIHLRHAGYPRGLLGSHYERESSKWSSSPARRYPILTEFVRLHSRMPRVPRCSSSTIVHQWGEKKVLRGEPPLPRILYTYTYRYLYPTLTPQQSERASELQQYTCIFLRVPLSLSLSNYSCQTTLPGCERGNVSL